MPQTQRVAHAPEKRLPELDEFLALFQFKFRRRESREATERYLTGLLTGHVVAPSFSSNMLRKRSWLGPMPGRRER